MSRGQRWQYPYITTQWLIDHGLAHDAVEEQAAEPLPVEMWVDPNAWLFRVRNIQPAFVAWVGMAARKSAVHIREVSLELRDFPDVQFSLLPPPGSRCLPYSFPDGSVALDQEDVLNEAFPRTLRQNDPLEGFLLGMAFKSLPDCLAGVIPAGVTAWNEFGTVVGSAQFEIALVPEEPRKSQTINKGKGLYVRDEEANSTEVLDSKPFSVLGTGLGGRRKRTEDQPMKYSAGIEE